MQGLARRKRDRSTTTRGRYHHDDAGDHRDCGSALVGLVKPLTPMPVYFHRRASRRLIRAWAAWRLTHALDCMHTLAALLLAQFHSMCSCRPCRLLEVPRGELQVYLCRCSSRSQRTRRWCYYLYAALAIFDRPGRGGAMAGAVSAGSVGHRGPVCKEMFKQILEMHCSYHRHCFIPYG